MVVLQGDSTAATLPARPNSPLHLATSPRPAQALSGPGAAYHIARKAIPSKGGAKVPGVKLEMFIFDPFHTAGKTTLFEARRRTGAAPALAACSTARHGCLSHARAPQPPTLQTP